MNSQGKRTAAVYGGNGFIGHHMARRLRSQGYWVKTVDIEEYAYGEVDYTDDYVIGDLRDGEVACENLFDDDNNPVDELYVYSSFMGGAGTIFTGKFDDEILYNSLSIDLNVVKCATEIGVGKVFWSSSACAYNQDLQQDPNNTGLKESDAIPANPDSDYGFAKLTSERIYQAFKRNKGLNIRIARFHNIFGIESSWNNNKEKFPAAICRKVSEAKDGTYVEVWGDGLQTRSFLCVSEAINGVQRLMASQYKFPLNIGSSEMISMNDLAKMVIEISGKNLTIKNVESNALGVRGRKSDNTLCQSVLHWSPKQNFKQEIEVFYRWVNAQVLKNAEVKI